VDPHIKRQKTIFGVIFGVFALFFLGVGLYDYDIQKNGKAAQATVTTCRVSATAKAGSKTICTGTWSTGNVLQGGEVVTGHVEGASKSDVGKRVDVRLRGQTAYVESLRFAYIMLAIGLAIALFGVRVVWKGNFRPGTPPPAGPAPQAAP
jgi:hypothetical protein